MSTMSKDKKAPVVEEEVVTPTEVVEEARKDERDADFYRRHTGAREGVIYE